jgi:hypothetical protein
MIGFRARKSVYSSVVTALLVSTGNPAAAKETLVELARRLAPMPILIERQRELVSSPFEPLVAEADLIVHATVTPIRTYLSADQREVFTDYAVSPIRMLFKRNVDASATPGVVASIVMTAWGGRMTVEGVEVVLRDRNAPQLGDRVEAALFLKEDAPGRYRLVSDVTGALGVTAGRIRFLNADEAYDERFKSIRDSTIDQVQREVERLKGRPVR